MLTPMKATAAVFLMLGTLAAGAGLTASHFLAMKAPEREIAADTPPDKPTTEKTERTDLYGDPLPPRALARMGTVRFRHDNLIGSVAYSRDGKMLAAGAERGLLRLYDPATGRTLRQFRAEAHLYPSIAFAPDGKTLASLGTNLIQFWDINSGKELHRFDIGAAEDHSFSTVPLVFSSDGRLLASVGADHSVRVWEAKSGKELAKLPGHQSRVCCLAFSPDGKTLLSASDRSGDQAGSVLVWKVTTGEEVRKISLHRPGAEVEPTPLCFSPDGKTLAIASWQWLRRKHAKGMTVMQAHAVALRDVVTGKEIRKMEPMLGRLKAASFSSDGKIITAMSDEQQSGSGTTKDEISRIQGWETATGKRLFNFPEPPTSSSFWGGQSLLAFAPDGKTLAAASGSSLHLWDLTQGRERLEKPETHQSKVGRVAFSPDGRTVATASSDHTLALWDAATGKQRLRLRGHEGEVWDLAFSPDGKLLASASHHMEQAVRLWDVAAGKELRCIDIPRLSVGDGSFWGTLTWVAFTANGKILASCTLEGRIRLWDVGAGKELFNQRVRGLPVLPKGHEAAWYFIHDPVFTHDGRTLAFSIAKAVYIVDVAAGQPLFQFEKGGFGRTVLALSPDGKTLLCRADKFLRLVETASGKNLHKLDLSAEEVNAAFTPDGRTIAVSAGDAGAAIHLFDVATGKELLHLRGHEARVNSLAFSPDGTKLASGQWDSTALVWDVSAARRQLPRSDLTAKDLDRLWTDLRDADAVKGHAALWTLVAAPDTAVPFLKQHLHPVPRIAPDRLQRLITDLDADEFARREQASRELAKLGSETEPSLRKVLEDKPSLETRRRAEALLKDLACQTEMTPDALRQIRAIQVLEQIRSAEAWSILKSLTQGAPAAPATRDAAAALSRLGQRSSVP